MRIRAIALRVTIFVAFAGFPALAAADPYEPNDSPTRATGPVHAGLDYDGAIETVVDEDWYVFYSPGVQQVIVSMTNDVGNACGYGQALQLIGPNGQLVYDGGFGYVHVKATHPFTGYAPVTRGRYYLRIYDDVHSPDCFGSYDLRLVPSDHFVNQAYLDAAGRLGRAQQAVRTAQSAVNKDRTAIRTDKARLRHNRKLSRKWRAWHRKLLADQRKPAADRLRLKTDQATVASIQAIINANNAPL